VFLVDEECNVALMNEGNLEDWFTCPQCGHEGFLADIDHNKGSKECKRWVKEIKGAF
jgi:transcription elongation factor Elf1